MFFIKYRPYIIAFLIGVAVYMQITEGLSLALYFYASALFMLIVELFFGNTTFAFNLLKRGQPEMASDLLDRTWNPNWLIKSKKAYYHFTKGLLFLQVKELDNALEQLKIAHNLGLKTPSDNALNALNIAHIYFTKKDKKQAKHYLEIVKSLSSNDLMMKERVTDMEKALKKMR